MRILQLGRYYPPHMGGIETVIFEITEGLNGRGIQCDVLCSNKTAALEISKYPNYVVIRTSSLANFLSTSISFQLISQLRKIIANYDIVHLHHPDPMATLALLLCNPRTKIVVHWHSDIVRQKFALFFYKPIQNLLIRRSDKIIATSANYAKSSQHLKHCQHKIEIVPIGIRADFKLNKTRLQELRDKYKGRKVIFSLGRHVYYKGFEYLVESATFLGDDYMILIGGEGPLYNELDHKVRSLGLSSKVQLLGKISPDDMAPLFELCDIFCMSSVERSEAFGVVLIEAMSFGKPVVATNIPGSGVNWVNAHNETGLNVEPKNPRALADAFVEICSDRERYNLFSARSKERFESTFTRGQMLKSLITLYSNLCG